MSNTPLKHISKLPKKLHEVSGIEVLPNSDLIWAINDSGNAAKLYHVNNEGKELSSFSLNAKNKDWEDLTSDNEGNIYIGDFGNNRSKRKHLSILKVNVDSLNDSKKINVERISFRYEDQSKFPPKKSQLYFDCEAFFYFNNNLYLFTKSRVKNDFGKTNMYKIPATPGNHVAKLVSSFTTCNELSCWITSADISDDGKMMALLTSDHVWLFTNFEDDHFFSGEVKSYDLGFESQKESVCFKDKQTLYIADERSHGEGGNIYKLKF